MDFFDSIGTQVGRQASCMYSVALRGEAVKISTSVRASDYLLLLLLQRQTDLSYSGALGEMIWGSRLCLFVGS